MNNIIFRGGLLLIQRQPLRYEPVNIILAASPAWISGVLFINNTPIYKIFPNRRNLIEIITLNNKYTLFANDNIIYESDRKYDYLIDVKLNNHRNDIPFKDFFGYYLPEVPAFD